MILAGPKYSNVFNFDTKQIFDKAYRVWVVNARNLMATNTRSAEYLQVLHYGKPGMGLRLKEGMMFTIEPMINAGKRDIKQMPDGWTIVTKDRSLSAQWEHTILVTNTGYEVMTLSSGSPAIPAFAIA